MKGRRFIPGIYNYCDYWCEKCPFTGRCRNFASGREMERASRAEKPPDDAANKAFWNRLADKLFETAAFGRPEPWDPGDNLPTDLLPDEDYEARAAQRRSTVKAHPLVRLAYAYMRQTGDWLKAADADLKTLAQELLEAAANAFDDSDPEEQAREIGEMIEVVAWYHTFLPPKLARAVGSLIGTDDAELEVLAEARLDDANGTGKVVLIAVERSTAAWLRLREIVPIQEDRILPLLALLSRMKRGIEETLPGAASFARPGFDADPEEEDNPCIER